MCRSLFYGYRDVRVFLGIFSLVPFNSAFYNDTFESISYEAVLIQHNPTFTLDVHWMWPSCVLVATLFESPMCFRCGVFIFVFIKKIEHVPGFGAKLVCTSSQ